MEFDIERGDFGGKCELASKWTWINTEMMDM